ncbi:hypothetical protein K461DRAFT_290035 [Myriangium duriaei CBS 260.36]|uniref:Cytochrome c oxidase, subunit VIb n=1 Tax=Myriangium duriaei CBS 260.36 TaxID=1168546 RepID=A0A9P4MSP7_9PEZI|nr:hypothetical protein K461DRAFT_290035 [Myriangium duriaei CBS 260.36]
MGWLPWSGSSSPTSSQDDTRPTGPDGYKPPDRSERALCWEARDAFFACLESNGIVDSIKNDAQARQACAASLQRFEKDCAASWVTYFKKRRVMEHQREMTIRRLEKEGADVSLPPQGGMGGRR